MEPDHPDKRVLRLEDVEQLKYHALLSRGEDGWYWISPDVLHSPFYTTGATKGKRSFTLWGGLPNEMKLAIAKYLPDVDLFALSRTSNRNRNLFLEFRIDRYKAFVRIPMFFHSYQTFEYLGFNSERAKSWFGGLDRHVMMRKSSLILFLNRNRVVYGQHHPKASEEEKTGIGGGLLSIIRRPEWDNVRLTQSLAYWVMDTVSIRFNALLNISHCSDFRTAMLLDLCRRCASCQKICGDYTNVHLVGAAGLTAIGAVAAAKHQSSQPRLPCCVPTDQPGNQGNQETGPESSFPCLFSRLDIHDPTQLSQREQYCRFCKDGSWPKSQKRDEAKSEFNFTAQTRLFLPTTLFETEPIDSCPGSISLEHLASLNFLNEIMPGPVSNVEGPIILYDWKTAQALSRFKEVRGRGYTKGIVLEVLIPLSLWMQTHCISPYDIDIHSLGETRRQIMRLPDSQFQGSDKTRQIPILALPYIGRKLRNYRGFSEEANKNVLYHMTDRQWFHRTVVEHYSAHSQGWILPLYTPKLFISPIPVFRKDYLNMTPGFVLWHEELPCKQDPKDDTTPEATKGPTLEPKTDPTTGHSTTGPKTNPKIKRRSSHRAWENWENEASIRFILTWWDQGPWTQSIARKQWCESLERRMQIRVRGLDWMFATAPSIFDGRDIVRLISIIHHEA